MKKLFSIILLFSSFPEHFHILLVHMNTRFILFFQKAIAIAKTAIQPVGILITVALNQCASEKKSFTKNIQFVFLNTKNLQYKNCP